MDPITTDAHTIVTNLLTDFAGQHLASGNKTAEALSHLLAGMRTAEYYRVDLNKDRPTVIAREYLRGVLADSAV